MEASIPDNAGAVSTRCLGPSRFSRRDDAHARSRRGTGARIDRPLETSARLPHVPKFFAVGAEGRARGPVQARRRSAALSASVSSAGRGIGVSPPFSRGLGVAQVGCRELQLSARKARASCPSPRAGFPSEEGPFADGNRSVSLSLTSPGRKLKGPGPRQAGRGVGRLPPRGGRGGGELLRQVLGGVIAAWLSDPVARPRCRRVPGERGKDADRCVPGGAP